MLTDTVKQFFYVPLEKLDAEIIDNGGIDSLESKCWKCDSKYVILGVSADLDYLAGRCNCKYLM